MVPAAPLAAGAVAAGAQGPSGLETMSTSPQPQRPVAQRILRLRPRDSFRDLFDAFRGAPAIVGGVYAPPVVLAALALGLTIYDVTCLALDRADSMRLRGLVLVPVAFASYYVLRSCMPRRRGSWCGRCDGARRLVRRATPLRRVPFSRSPHRRTRTGMRRARRARRWSRGIRPAPPPPSRNRGAASSASATSRSCWPAAAP